MKYFVHLLVSSPSRLYVDAGHTECRHHWGFYSVLYVKSLCCAHLVGHSNFSHSNLVRCASRLSNTDTSEATRYGRSSVLFIEVVFAQAQEEW